MLTYLFIINYLFTKLFNFWIVIEI